MNKTICSIFAMLTLGMSQVTLATEKYIAGKDYTVLKSQVKTDHPAKIEVREFFTYSCSHCFALESQLQPWLKKGLAKDIYFIRTPAAMNPIWEQNARGYYVSEVLGIRQKVHLQLFENIQLKRQPLFDQQKLSQFYAKYGVNSFQFNQLYNSPAITGKINISNQLAKKYQLTGVPAIAINGKYLIQGEHEHMADIIEYLIQKERI